MKSRTSYFNKTVFKKNLTRFAPAWGLYTVCALMGLMMLLMDSGSKWMVSDLLGSLTVLSIITPCYALLCAQLLFGDLYNTRMCNALHALPMRRETWFTTNVLSGFAFHLIPTAVMSILAAVVLMIYCPPEHIWAAPIWFAGVNLQFMCFFGIAVFCAFCVGSRFAQAVVYGIVNFGALIAGWLLDTLYIPQFYGIQLNFAPFMNFCPIGKMVDAPFVRAARYFEQGTMEVQANITYKLGDGFAYYFMVAAIGIALIFLAMQLYRRRNLECAGDFMAVKGLEPVFLVVYTLIVGAAFYFFTEAMMGMDTVFFLFVGLAVGWFTGKMLLERSVRVFQLKSFLGCGVLMLVFGLTLVTAALDPFGFVRWVPKADQVEAVGVSAGWYGPGSLHEDITLTDPEDIQTVIGIHQEAVDIYETHGTYPVRVVTAETSTNILSMTKEELEAENSMNFSMPLTLVYHMKDGRAISRYYEIWMGDETGEYVKRIFSTPEAVFSSGITEEEFLTHNQRVVIQDAWDGQEHNLISREDIRGLYRAILADCEAGTMSQQWDFHYGDDVVVWIYMENMGDITVFSDCEHTLNWLRDYGVDVDALIDRYAE